MKFKGMGYLFLHRFLTKQQEQTDLLEEKCVEEKKKRRNEGRLDLLSEGGDFAGWRSTTRVAIYQRRRTETVLTFTHIFFLSKHVCE